jgi:hypothetical protein
VRAVGCSMKVVQIFISQLCCHHLGNRPCTSTADMVYGLPGTSNARAHLLVLVAGQLDNDHMQDSQRYCPGLPSNQLWHMESRV